MRWLMVLLVAISGAGCSEEGGKDPATAERAPIDRFSAAAGTLFVRDVDPTLPGPNVAIDYDARFLMRGLGPAGERVLLYHFDVRPTVPAPIYVLFRAGEALPVEGQKNIVTVIPGDPGYNDLWQPVRVEVPSDYVANSLTSYEELAGLPMQAMPALVNCPVVPEGSVALTRTPGDYAELTQGWYEGKIIQYFHFGEAPGLAPVADAVPTSTVYVAYDVNPTSGAPGAGFAVEPGTAQTHNVVATLPADAGYSPLWSVNVYDRAAFDGVSDLATAMAAPRLTTGAGLVNAPIARVLAP